MISPSLKPRSNSPLWIFSGTSYPRLERPNVASKLKKGRRAALIRSKVPLGFLVKVSLKKRRTSRRFKVLRPQMEQVRLQPLGRPPLAPATSKHMKETEFNSKITNGTPSSPTSLLRSPLLTKRGMTGSLSKKKNALSKFPRLKVKNITKNKKTARLEVY